MRFVAFDRCAVKPENVRKGDVVKRFEPAGSMNELESLIKSLL